MAMQLGHVHIKTREDPQKVAKFYIDNFGATVTRLSQLDPDLGNFADGLNGNWLIGLVRSRKNSGKAAAVPTK